MKTICWENGIYATDKGKIFCFKYCIQHKSFVARYLQFWSNYSFFNTIECRRILYFFASDVIAHDIRKLIGNPRCMIMFRIHYIHYIISIHYTMRYISCYCFTYSYAICYFYILVHMYDICEWITIDKMYIVQFHFTL